jgi:hypothetical protein
MSLTGIGNLNTVSNLLNFAYHFNPISPFTLYQVQNFRWRRIAADNSTCGPEGSGQRKGAPKHGIQLAGPDRACAFHSAKNGHKVQTHRYLLLPGITGLNLTL